MCHAQPNVTHYFANDSDVKIRSCHNMGLKTEMFPRKSGGLAVPQNDYDQYSPGVSN